MKAPRKKTQTTALYRYVYGSLFTGFGLYQLILLRGSGRTLLLSLSAFIIATGLLLMLPASFRKKFIPGFLKNSQAAALMLWLALPFLILGSILLTRGKDTGLALTGTAIAVTLILTAFYCISKKRKRQ